MDLLQVFIDIDSYDSMGSKTALLGTLVHVAAFFHPLQVLVEDEAEVHELPRHHLRLCEALLLDSHPFERRYVLVNSFFTVALAFCPCLLLLLLIHFDLLDLSQEAQLALIS